MSEERIIEWLNHERDSKRQIAMLNSKHKGLRNLAYVLADMDYQQHKGASDTRNIVNTRINNTRKELLQAGITMDDMNRYETPDQLPPEKKAAAYRVLDQHT